MPATDPEIKQHLDQLLGLPLCLSRRAAAMLILHFGTLRVVESSTIGNKGRKPATVGDFALHIQCPWRLESTQGIITGRGDLYLNADTCEYFNELEAEAFYEQGKNLQDRRLGALLQGIEPLTGAYMNITPFLIVESTAAEAFGEVTLALSGGYRLRIFPHSSQGEHWRLFQCATALEHFVVEA